MAQNSNKNPLPYKLRIKSADNKADYVIVNPNQIFEVCVSWDMLYPNLRDKRQFPAKISVKLPKKLELVEGKLEWQGNLSFSEDKDIFMLSLRGNKDGLHTISAELHLYQDNHWKLADSCEFGACISDDSEKVSDPDRIDDTEDANKICNRLKQKYGKGEYGPGKFGPAK